MIVDLTKQDLGRVIEGLGDPREEEQEKFPYKDSGSVEEVYGLVEFWQWSGGWYEAYSEKELWQYYQQLKAGHK